MEFEVVEVKKLTSRELAVSTLQNGNSPTRDRLSIRLEREEDGTVFTIHAVVPWDIAGLHAPTIGALFEFGLATHIWELCDNPELLKKTWKVGDHFKVVLSNCKEKVFCQDTVCKFNGFTEHVFGPGCRLWGSVVAEQAVK
jgi:hypothetical protein